MVSSTRSSAAKPENTSLSLKMLNKASAKTGGKWQVTGWNPVQDAYEYTWQGKPRKGTTFILILVSTDDPSCYVQAQFKKTATNERKYQEAIKKFTKGARFVMSNVSFADDAKAAYVSSPLKTVVDLSKTTMEACVGESDSAVQPVPTATVAGSSGLGTNQFFDLTALIHEIKPIREHDNNRSSFVVVIHDGTLDTDTGKVKLMPLKVYFDTKPPILAEAPGKLVSTAYSHAFLEEQLMAQKAVAFFRISGAQDEHQKFSFRSTKHACFAKAVGPKADKLNSDAALQNLESENTVTFEIQSGKAARDWSQEQARETTCKLLAQFGRNFTGVRELDEEETVWQINWATATEPSQGQGIKTHDGTRIWFSITLYDESGPIVLYITEAAAVKLANVVDAAEFEQFHAENRLRFPFLSSVKVLRRCNKPSVAQPGSITSDNEFDCFIVDAAEQNMSEAPSFHSAMLLPMLGDSTDNVLPAALGMIRKSDHYAMNVQYLTQAVPPELTKWASQLTAGVSMLRSCTRAVALIQSTKKSKLSEAGENGHRVVTEEVVDLLDCCGESGRKYTLVSFCTLDNVLDFKLDPTGRNKSQAALVNVTTILDEGTDSAAQPVKELLVDNVQLLTMEEVEALKPILTKKLYFAALAGQISKKRQLAGQTYDWSLDENPAKASKCRVLGRSPTGPQLPDYSTS